MEEQNKLEQGEAWGRESEFYNALNKTSWELKFSQWERE